ncbi:MAG: hypothetical protein HOY71_01695 [Nonomuraea sp.]|nr:hypothetical protein [Nonomuraea sp.]
MSWQSYRARWAGTDYEAAPEVDGGRLRVRLRGEAPAEGFEEVAPGRYVRVVPAAECAGLWHVTTVCEWRGAPFLVLDERESELLLEYTGGRASAAVALGLERAERGVYRRWIPREEVSEVHEELVSIERS